MSLANMFVFASSMDAQIKRKKQNKTASLKRQRSEVWFYQVKLRWHVAGKTVCFLFKIMDYSALTSGDELNINGTFHSHN